ncbi:MAG: peptide chain release factor-like protein [Coriobacteriales bacterium]|nr:peptide chain release factor-like protein [Coriobacteriales bacterium]
MAAQQLKWYDYARFARMSDEELERDCEFSAFHASGPGGQGVNTADSAVRMRHRPSGLVVTSRENRTQLLNRKACLQKLRRLFESRARRPKTRKPTKPSKGAVERRLAGKRRDARIKQARRRPGMDD